jgi:hypothetical protein
MAMNEQERRLNLGHMQELFKKYEAQTGASTLAKGLIDK